MTIEHESFLLISGIVFLIACIIVLFKGKYTWQGFGLYTLTFWAFISLVYFTIIPLELRTDFNPTRYTLLGIPFYSKTIEILKYGGTWIQVFLFFIKYLLLVIPVAVGTVLLRKQKETIPKSIIVLDVTVLLLGFLNAMGRLYTFDAGAFLCLFAGTVIGIKLGKWIKKKNIFHLFKEEEENDFS